MKYSELEKELQKLRAVQDAVDPESRRKGYAAPHVIHSEILGARAVVCAKGDDVSCGAGPLNS